MRERMARRCPRDRRARLFLGTVFPGRALSFHLAVPASSSNANQNFERERKPVRATIMYAAGDVQVQQVPDVSVAEPTDALIRVVRACICGSDLWPYNSMERSEAGQSMGHEAIGVVEDVGDDVRTLERGDLVVMPFAISDGTC